MKFNELLTDLDEKKEQVLESVSELEQLEEGINIFTIIDEMDFMDDILISATFVLTDDFIEVIEEELKEETGVCVKEEEKEGFKKALSDYIESRREVLMETHDKCMEIADVLADCELLNGEYPDFYVSVDLTTIVFFNEDNESKAPIILPFETLLSDDYKDAAVEQILSNKVLSVMAYETDAISSILSDNYDIGIHIVTDMDKTIDESHIALQICNAIDGNEIFCTNETMSVKEYLQVGTKEHFDHYEELIRNSESLMEIDKDIICSSLQETFSSLDNVDNEDDLIERDISDYEDDFLRDLEAALSEED